MINTKKIIMLFIIVLLLNVIFLPKAFAISDIINDGDEFLSKGTQEVVEETAVRDTNTKVYNILLGVGITVAVIIGAVLGIQFIFGSVEGKAKIAEALVPYIVGCAVVFGAFGIWGIVVNTGNELVPEKQISASATQYGVAKCPTCGEKTTLDARKLSILEKDKKITLQCGHKHGYSDGVTVSN